MPTRKSIAGMWKAAERKVADFFNTVRRPLSGLNHGTGRGDDCQHDVLYLEVKQGGKSPLLNHAAALYKHTRIKQEAEAPEMVPVIALCPKGMQGFLIVVHSSDLENLCIEYLHQKGYQIK